MVPTTPPPATSSALNSLLRRTDQTLAGWLRADRWQWRVVAVCLIVSVVQMVLSNPSTLWFYGQFWKSVRAGQEFDAYATVKAQAATFYQDLGFSHFSNSSYESVGHLYKMRFRLLLPFVVATFGIRSVGVTLWVIQLVLGVAFVRMATSFTQRILADRIGTFWFMLGFSLLYPVRSAWLDITAYGDFFAYFLLLLAVYVHRPWAIFLALQLAFWTDERALINAVYVLLWYGFDTVWRTGRYRPTSQQFAVVTSGLGYVLLRALIGRLVSFPVIDGAYWPEFVSTYYENIKVGGFRVWGGFLSDWMLILMAVGSLLMQRRFGLTALFAGTLVLTTNLSLIVYDVNRSLSYGYLAIFIALAVLVRSLSVNELRRLLLITVAFMLLTPLPNRLRLPNAYILM